MEMTPARISSREIEWSEAGTGRECVEDWRMATLTTRERIREDAVILMFEKWGWSAFVSVSE